MTTWFTSDLHFFHKNLLTYQRGVDFETVEEMNETLINNYNSVVDPDDEVYFLGDVVMGIRAESLPYIEAMNGYKVLVPGNHDSCAPMYHRKNNYEKSLELYGTYFQEILDSEVSINIGDSQATLCHFPGVLLDHSEDIRYERWYPVDAYERGDWIIHGHLHCKDIQVAKRHIHVGVDSDYRAYDIPLYHPIPLEVIEEVIQDEDVNFW